MRESEGPGRQDSHEVFDAVRKRKIKMEMQIDGLQCIFTLAGLISCCRVNVHSQYAH